MTTLATAPRRAAPAVGGVTVAEYHRMVEDGRLEPDARVELIDGEILAMAPIGSDHGRSSTVLARTVIRLVPDRVDARVAQPIRLNDTSEPEPDLAIVRHRDDDYADAHPTPADTLLIVEIADSSLARDRGIKRRAYARAGIPEYWIVDLRARVVEIHRDPVGETYASFDRRADGVVALAADPGIVIPLSGIIWSRSPSNPR